MLDRQNKSHGSFPICESAYKTWFYTRRPKCDKRVPRKSTLFYNGDALWHCQSVAFVHFKVLMFVWIKMLVSYLSMPLHPSCDLTHTLSVRQRSTENTEKKKRTEVWQKKASIWVGSRWEVIRSRFLVPRAFSVKNLSKSMSFHVQVIPDQAGMHLVWCLALQCSISNVQTPLRIVDMEKWVINLAK